MAFVASPSSLSEYLNCPRRFMGRYITKEIKWEAKHLSRGTEMHELAECRLHGKPLPDGKAFDTQVDVGYLDYVCESAQRLKNSGYRMFVEHNLAVTKEGNPCDFFDSKVMFRARADAIFVHHEGRPVVIGDIKTGKSLWNKTHFQLRCEALLAHLIYKAEIVDYQYWYIDEGQTDGGIIDFRQGLGSVQDIFESLRDVYQSVKNSYYPPKNNKFCKWCPWFQTTNCGL